MELAITAKYRFSSASPKGAWRYWISRTWKNVDHKKAASALSLRVSYPEAEAILAIARAYSPDTITLDVTLR